MNLIEAIKSGKPFRRTSWGSRQFIDPRSDRLDLPLDAIVADDWEVDEKKVTLTSTEFHEAWSNATRVVDRYDPIQLKAVLMKELGF